MSIDLAQHVIVGTSLSRGVQVSPDKTVGALVAGMPYVYSTPYMITMMEILCEASVAEQLPAGYVSVGTLVHVAHLKATPLNFTVTTTSTVRELRGNTICFDVEAHDGVELIGRGQHERGVVELSRFIDGNERKAKQVPA